MTTVLYVGTIAGCVQVKESTLIYQDIEQGRNESPETEEKMSNTGSGFWWREGN